MLQSGTTSSAWINIDIGKGSFFILGYVVPIGISREGTVPLVVAIVIIIYYYYTALTRAIRQPNVDDELLLLTNRSSLL